MFIGHFGVGLGSKAIAPKTSLGTLFLAAQFVDLLWPILLMLGWEQVEIVPDITAVTPLDFVHYPISHSLLMGVVWGVVFAVVYGLVSRYPKGALVCGFVVLSHWVLDFVTHRPDLQLMPGYDMRVGLGLWFSVWGTVLVEGLIFVVGVWFYMRATRAVDRVGSVGFGVLVGFLLLIHVGNLFGDPPPNPEVLAGVAHAQWLFIVWGYWIDRHREGVVDSL